MPSVSKSYLLIYNVLQSVGWAVAFFQVIAGIKQAGSLTGAYATAGETVGFFQFLAVLEILHAAIGIVGGSPVTSLMQWGGRSNVLFAVVKSVPEVQATPAVGAMLLVWALSEVVRYPWYAAVTAGVCPQWLTWLRYTAFIALYPVGVVGEMHAVYLALPYIGARKLHSVTLPNSLNFAFDYRVFMIVS
ncbi:hypothetical protein Ndes2526B_g07369 [Nannochloris sp. 'desiccata']|nr:hypothetical protein KSW81_004619 [Chlorella desiccata (nom. nud.)]KAH7618430.1 putative Very-long-chain (3R)-3-hydroxyacyl-CoA dehydratase 2 [Chlorella desiccata (nom. nud.)]